MSTKPNSGHKIRLSELHKGTVAKITAVGVEPGISDEFVRRLLEMGILEGSDIEVIHEAPFGRDPLAVRVRGALIALRRHEALHIEVEVSQTPAATPVPGSARE